MCFHFAPVGGPLPGLREVNWVEEVGRDVWGSGSEDQKLPNAVKSQHSRPKK